MLGFLWSKWMKLYWPAHFGLKSFYIVIHIFQHSCEGSWNCHHIWYNIVEYTRVKKKVIHLFFHSVSWFLLTWATHHAKYTYAFTTFRWCVLIWWHLSCWWQYRIIIHVNICHSVVVSLTHYILQNLNIPRQDLGILQKSWIPFLGGCDFRCSLCFTR